ncbi:hypothetical protein CCAX7_33270 [Capsulimonas corticalis]|uniref:Uncharacterized protein n=1 Tax=Capsulimonas corticalis TaxID=2219043 RepID=A0A402CYM9_9BACT|nr:STM4014 family protein [Capsulimonas corticalis]BDI31276.1 hypothetical protein CCAX7_33270 [Capsulimonas corticalis]
MSSYVIVGNPGGNRIAFFQEALERRSLPPARVAAWADIIEGRARLRDIVRAGDCVRIESPGRDFEVERLLLAAGASETPSGEGLSPEEARSLAFERGRIWFPRQWYLGFQCVLRQIEQQLSECPAHRLTNGLSDIAVMFDKAQTHERLRSAGVSVPEAFTNVRSFADLTARLQQAGWGRVFVKLAHGSSASGVAALRTDGRRMQATTTVEIVRAGDELRLYNSRRLRTYNDPREIAELIDALCRHGVHVERWLPKAAFGDAGFDLRVVTIGGRARHTVVRQSHSPMTNLHLLNTRGDLEAVKERMGSSAWDAAIMTCERAAACFPASLHAGVDLCVTPSFRHHAVLEVNAFGDLLPRVLHDGMDTYEAEIRAFANREEL